MKTLKSKLAHGNIMLLYGYNTEFYMNGTHTERDMDIVKRRINIMQIAVIVGVGMLLGAFLRYTDFSQPETEVIPSDHPRITLSMFEKQSLMGATVLFKPSANEGRVNKMTTLSLKEAEHPASLRYPVNGKQDIALQPYACPDSLTFFVSDHALHYHYTPPSPGTPPYAKEAIEHCLTLGLQLLRKNAGDRELQS